MNNKPKFLNKKTIELVNNYSNAVKAMTGSKDKTTGLIWTKNVTGDLGEYYVREFFNNTPNMPNIKLEKNSNKDIDAIDEDGITYAIKTVTTNTTGSIRGEGKLFDYLIIVKLDDSYMLEKIMKCSWKEYNKIKTENKRTGADKVTNTKKISEIFEILYQREE